MTQNMYRVGDYVYFESSNNQPYHIRRIEELHKGTNGNVEARVVCFYRRRDIPEKLLKIADQADREDSKLKRTGLLASVKSDEEGGGGGGDENGTASVKHESENENGVPGPEAGEAMEVDDAKVKHETDDNGTGVYFGGLPSGADELALDQVHLLRQRELFMSRQVETLSATNIRGKCSVVLLSDVETPDMYLNKEDAYFYSLVYDPTNESLIADKGSIRVGEKYQAEIGEPTPLVLKKLERERKRKELTDDTEGLAIDDDEDDELSELEKVKRQRLTAPRSIGNVPVNEGRETLIFHPHHNMSEREIDQYLILARSVGTFARALEGNSSSKLPTIHMTAAAASRDVTLLQALALLHHADYDMGRAVKYLVPPPSRQHYPLEADEISGNSTQSIGGPLLCRDQLEEWSPAEAHIFAEAIEKYNKDFHEVRTNCLGWKSQKDIVEYYYMYKTSGRYADGRKEKKAAAQDGRLKQVYIPNYNKPSPNLIGPPSNVGEKVTSSVPCESCRMDTATNFYHWGPPTLRLRVCQDCWVHWKKRGGLKRPHDNEKFDFTDSAATPETQATLHKQMTIINPTGINRGTVQSTASIANQSTVRPTHLPGVKNSQIVAQLPPGVATPNQQAMSALTQPSKAAIAFFLHTTLLAKLARKIAPKELFNPRKSARNPFKEVNSAKLKEHLLSREPSEVVGLVKAMQLKHGIPPSLFDFLVTERYRRTQIKH